MRFKAATLEFFDQVNKILAEYDGPLTLRQIFYRLVAALVLPNTQGAYSNLSKHLVNARRAGIVDEDRIIDRVRSTLRVACWEDLASFMRTVRRSYRREKWSGQETHVEVWCEKDAVAGVLEPITEAYEVTLYPCRGYNSYSALLDAGRRLSAAGKPAVILYLGDFDPSGQDMPRDIRDRLSRDFGVQHCDVNVIALTSDQIEEHELPPMAAKRSDSRAAAFIAEHGNISVELDALPPDILRDLVDTNLAQFCDAQEFNEQRRIQEEEQERLNELIDAI